MSAEMSNYLDPEEEMDNKSLEKTTYNGSDEENNSYDYDEAQSK